MDDKEIIIDNFKTGLTESREIFRISWVWLWWIKYPLHINKTDLNKAWVNKWNMATSFNLKDIKNIIKPTCLRVEKATISFKSNLLIAIKPPIIRVPKDKIKRKVLYKKLNTWLKRNIIWTPAVTKVDECTREDTGVGAAMALGSQKEKGNWALLVREAKSKKKHVHKVKYLKVKTLNLKFSNDRQIEIITKQSPNRLVNKAAILLCNLLTLW